MEWVNLEQLSGPASEPLDRDADLKPFLNYEDTDQDSLITSLGKAARSYVEQTTRRALISQTWRGSFQEPPRNSEVWLPRPRIVSVENVKYYDSDGVLQTLEASKYHVVTGENGRVVITAWPGAHATKPDRYQINWTSGYGDAGSDVPEDILIAIKLLVTFWFDNRNPDTKGNTFVGKDAEIPTPIKVLLDAYRVPLKRS